MSFMMVIEVAFFALALVLCVPVAMFCLEVLLSLLPRKLDRFGVLPTETKVAVLIPAHNEEGVIVGTLRSVLPTVPAVGRVMVVADNCTDRTAEIARELGAEVVERYSTAQRGKGFALDFGIRHLQASPPDVVVFLDADCRTQPETVERLAAAALVSGRPIQGLNLCDPDPRGGYGQLASGFAFRFKNLVRTLGLVRLAGLCHLTGTGMALPWDLISKVRFADGNVVEDMQLGIDLALAGKPALFVPEARVDSPLPTRPSAVRSQRTRWEHGHLKTLLSQAPRLAALAFRRFRLDLLLLALDLAVPPLSLLVMALGGLVLASAAGALLGISAWPLCLAWSALTCTAVAIFLGWAAHCREVVPFRTLVAAPYYAVAKLPIYLAFLRRPQAQWIRTERDCSQSA